MKASGCRWPRRKKINQRPTKMSEEFTPFNPELICDEQLEEIAGGFLDTNVQTMNNNCSAQISSVVTL
jgi:hypothetical protein